VEVINSDGITVCSPIVSLNIGAGSVKKIFLERNKESVF
jgi:hypothetical protein